MAEEGTPKPQEGEAKPKRDESIRGNIPKELKDWILKEIQAGEFRSESDAVEKGLRLLRDRKAKSPVRQVLS